MILPNRDYCIDFNQIDNIEFLNPNSKNLENSKLLQNFEKFYKKQANNNFLTKDNKLKQEIPKLVNENLTKHNFY